MAQSALTCTPPNPTPPTNMGFQGATPPNPPNFTKVNYAEPFGARDASGNFTDETPPGVRVNPNPPPYYDDGTAGALTQITSAQPALAGGTGATSGGTEGTYPGTGTGVSGVGPVPAATSVENEARGTETLSPASGINNPYGQLVSVSVLGNFTGVATPAGVMTSPNATHASSMSPVTNPALVSISPTTAAAAATGTQVITCTGTGFVPGCRIWHDGVEQTTTFTNATTISATVKKRPFAAVVPVVVKLGGVQMGAAPNFTWT